MTISCTPTTRQESINIDTAIEIAVNDETGKDLLNSKNSDSFKEEKIKIFSSNKGDVKEVYDTKSNFLIYEQDTKYLKHIFPNSNSQFLLRLFPNHNAGEKLPITYIQWTEEDTDKIQCQYRRSKGSVTCTKVWLNGEVVWDVAANVGHENPRIIKIVK